MKKLFALSLAILLALSLAACSEKEAEKVGFGLTVEDFREQFNSQLENYFEDDDQLNSGLVKLYSLKDTLKVTEDGRTTGFLLEPEQGCEMSIRFLVDEKSEHIKTFTVSGNTKHDNGGFHMSTVAALTAMLLDNSIESLDSFTEDIYNPVLDSDYYMYSHNDITYMIAMSGDEVNFGIISQNPGKEE